MHDRPSFRPRRPQALLAVKERNPVALLALLLVLMTLSMAVLAAAPSHAQGANEVEMEFWRSIKDSDAAGDYRAYLEQYPEGAFAALAKSRLERLQGSSARPSAPPPVAARPPESRRQRVERIIHEHLRGFLEPRVYFAPRIPPEKLQRATEVYQFDPSRVLMLYDDGLGKGGKTGFCLTEDKIYWRAISGSPPYVLDYRDIRDVVFLKKKLKLETSI